MTTLIGYAFIFIVSILGWRLRLLTGSGAIAASIIGGSIYMSYSYTGLFLLGAFFGSSSFWSVYKRELKKKSQDKNAKSERRDWTQVFANGGAAALAAVLGAYFEGEIFFVAFTTALAAANADTWASEIGVLSKRKPFHLLRMKKVESGTSGAVSLLGFAASFAGAFFIAITAAFLYPSLSLTIIFIVCLLGFSGSVVDTILGASIQVYYVCEVCGAETEKKVHCAEPTSRKGGFRFMNNEMVNFFSSFIVALLIFILNGFGLF
ncbi:DUF92 domain-containing protein [Bacillus tianshenii]|nr:DUF92 domain-containing protein [Bacillus tianshenii]